MMQLRNGSEETATAITEVKLAITQEQSFS